MDAYSSGEEVVIKTRKPYTITKQRERWTEEEHSKFLEALKLYGRQWQRIEEHIGTKTAVQIRSHAQKFFSKLEKEALLKGVPIGQSIDIDIPPPRPKRKPTNPYPRKTSAGGQTSQGGGKDGKLLVSVSSAHCKQALDLEKEPHPEEVSCSFVSSADKSSTSVSLINPGTLREFIPLTKELTSQDETDESFVTTELKESRKLEIGAEGKHTEQSNGTSKASKMEDSDASHAKLVHCKKTDDLNCALTIEGMQGNQNYPRHVPVQVLDGKLGTGTQNPTQDMLFPESIFQPMGAVNRQPNIFTNVSSPNASESQNNPSQSSIHQPFPPYPPPFSQIHQNQDHYQSFLQMSSTFSSLVVSTLLQNPAAHAAASFAATFWPYANIEASADSPACLQGAFPSRQIGSPPSMAAIAAATVAAATGWWAAHGFLPLCAPFHSAFPCPPASTAAVPSMDNGEMPAAKTDLGETTLQLPLQDQNPEYTDALQVKHSASKSSAISSSEQEESGEAKTNASSKASDNEKNKANTEHLDSNKMKGRKQVDRSSCGSNTTSSSEVETDALEKDEKGKEENKEPDANRLAIDSRNRRARSVCSLPDSWKEVSEEGRLAFQALFSREVLPQSFSPPHDLTNQDHQTDNIEDNKHNMDDKLDYIKKCGSDCRGAEQNLSFVQKHNEEEVLLTIGLGQVKLKTSRTGFKPYKRCSMEAKENKVGAASSQGDEKGAKKIRLEAEAST